MGDGLLSCLSHICLVFENVSVYLWMSLQRFPGGLRLDVAGSLKVRKVGESGSKMVILLSEERARIF